MCKYEDYRTKTKNSFRLYGRQWDSRPNLLTLYIGN